LTWLPGKSGSSRIIDYTVNYYNEKNVNFL